MTQTKRIFIVAGEHSGDLLGGKLIEAMKCHGHVPMQFRGVSGDHMIQQGAETIFPMADVAVMGPAAILGRLPKLVRRVYQTVDDALAFKPDLIVIIDSPEFTHPIAKRLRQKMPHVPIIDYVSPSVWAWRPGRARKMKPYVDHLLALLPFEPEAHKRLGGPLCSYVGHPLIEKAGWIDNLDIATLREKLELTPRLPVLVVLPGSRPSEVSKLMAPFGEAIRALRSKIGPMEIILPVVPSVRHLVEDALLSWPQQPYILEDETDKFKAFRLADAALAASGTVTLELGVSGTPMVIAYRMDRILEPIRFLLKVPSVVLANLVIGENAFPELLQEECTPEKLSNALLPLMSDTPERRKQQLALSKVRSRLFLPHGTPSEEAAKIVLRYLTPDVIFEHNTTPIKQAS